MPPVSLSSIFTLKEDANVGGINLKKGDDVNPNIYMLHHNNS